MALQYLFKSVGKNYKVSVSRILIWTRKRRTLYGSSAYLLKYIYLFAVKNKMEKI